MRKTLKNAHPTKRSEAMPFSEIKNRKSPFGNPRQNIIVIKLLCVKYCAVSSLNDIVTHLTTWPARIIPSSCDWCPFRWQTVRQKRPIVRWTTSECISSECMQPLLASLNNHISLWVCWIVGSWWPKKSFQVKYDTSHRSWIYYAIRISLLQYHQLWSWNQLDKEIHTSVQALKCTLAKRYSQECTPTTFAEELCKRKR